MMPFRKILLRRIAVAVFLLAGLLTQAQVVFACDLMDGARQVHCCCEDEMAGGCEMGGGCETHNGAMGGADCCVISVDSASDVAVTVAVSLNSPINLLNGPQPPTDVLFTTSNNIGPPPRMAAAVLAISYVAPVRANVYQLTKRIRI